mmetsp:Transcript_8707/g.7405  ORF Transcript_8707/g.7405 Transcript_8707/m.7405 type:complete len:158 (+) Transcript_8707:58-531(+)
MSLTAEEHLPNKLTTRREYQYDTVLISSSTLNGSSLSDLWYLPSLTAAAAPLARSRLIISILPNSFGSEYNSIGLCDVIDAIYQSAGVHGHPFLDVEVRLNANLDDARGPQCVLVGGVGIMNEEQVDIMIPINDNDKIPNDPSSSSTSCIPLNNQSL